MSAPLLPEGPAPEIPAGWAGRDGFMARARYMALFEGALAPFYRALGFPPGYRRASGCATFALEGHAVFLADVRPGERLRARFRFADADDRRIHYVQTLHRAEGGPPVAAYECLCMHVDLARRRGAPMPAEAQAKARALADAHRELDWPVSPRRRIRFRPPRDAAGR